MPTFNEEKAIGLVLDEVFEAGYKNVLVVDGYSVDSRKVAQQNGSRKVVDLWIGFICWLSMTTTLFR